MIERKGRNSTLILFLFTAVFLNGCRTVVQEYNITEAEGPSRFTVKMDKEGTLYGEYRNPLIPAAVIYTDVEKGTKENLRLYVTKVRFFTNWPNGWTEGVYEASGMYLISDDTENARIKLQDEFTLWDIVSGEIRYFDTYYRGDDGFSKVKNRIDRMTEISRYLQEEKGFPPYYRENNFLTSVEEFLFPEVTGAEKGTGGKKETALGAGIFWNKGYSEKILPEQYIELRNSGTLYRDFEEAPELFYTIYNLDYVMNTYLQEGTSWH